MDSPTSCLSSFVTDAHVHALITYWTCRLQIWWQETRLSYSKNPFCTFSFPLTIWGRRETIWRCTLKFTSKRRRYWQNVIQLHFLLALLYFLECEAVFKTVSAWMLEHIFVCMFWSLDLLGIFMTCMLFIFFVKSKLCFILICNVWCHVHFINGNGIEGRRISFYYKLGKTRRRNSL